MRTVLFLVAALYSGAILADLGQWRKIELHDVPDELEKVNFTVPAFGQTVVFPMPRHWKPAHEQVVPTSYIVELIPQAETLDTWTQMLTLRAHAGKGMGHPLTPEAILALTAMGHREHCEGREIVFPLGERQVDSYDAYAAIIGCGSVVGGDPDVRSEQGEVAYFLAIKGAEDMYVIHQSVRRPTMDRETSPMQPHTVADIEQKLLTTKLCERTEERGACWSRDPR